MENIYLFDVDGTLTPARQPMTEEFADFFTDWCKDKRVFLISGSDYIKLEEQVSQSLLKSLDGVFGCMGNTYHFRGLRVYRSNFVVPSALRAYLDECLERSSFPLRTGNHMERRTGMLNFSIIGRNATQDERKTYHEYDCEHQERITIAKTINESYEGIEAAVGGEISIDIYPTGSDKSQILAHIPKGHYVFFGDRMESGGNDYALAQKLQETESYALHPVNTYQDTWNIIKENYL